MASSACCKSWRRIWGGSVAEPGRPVLEARGLVKRFDGVIATLGVDIQIRPGEVHAVIGPNGAGKSTLIAQLSGELMPDQGKVLLEGEDVTGLPIERRAAHGIAR